MQTGIDPTNDFAFKKIFGQPSHAGLTLSLVNSLLPLAGRRPAASLRIQNPFVLSDFVDGKEVILDLRLEDSEGRDIQVEMQVKTGGPLERRMLDNWARVYAEQLPKGDGYEAWTRGFLAHEECGGPGRYRRRGRKVAIFSL